MVNSAKLRVLFRDLSSVTCKVVTPRACGTGIFVMVTWEKDQVLCILTNKHVVNSKEEATHTQVLFDHTASNVFGPSVRLDPSRFAFFSDCSLDRGADPEGLDFALIPITRKDYWKLIGRFPIKLSRTSMPRIKDVLIILGHPRGKPQHTSSGILMYRSRQFLRYELELGRS